MTPQAALDVAARFWSAVWIAPQDFDAIDRLVAEDFTIVSGGKAVRGREAFKAWAIGFASRIRELEFE